MAKFKKGDVCIITKSVNNPKLVGTEVTLISDMQEVFVEDSGFKTSVYETDFINSRGLNMYAQEEVLTLKNLTGETKILEMFKVVR